MTRPMTAQRDPRAQRKPNQSRARVDGVAMSEAAVKALVAERGGMPRTELEPVVDLDALPESHELGIELRALKTPESPQIRALWETFADDVAGACAPSREWRGMPAFIPVSEPPKLTVVVPGEDERTALVDRLGVTIANKTGDAWSAWWPPRGRQDLAALRFEVGLDDDERVWGPFDWSEGVGGGERAEAA